jgi:integrase
LGHYTLADLGWTAINSFYKERQSGRSKKTVYNIHRVLSEALRHAVRRGLIVRNPCEVADAPKPDKPTPRALMPAEAAHLLECAKSEPQWYPIVYLALHTGMRQGELLALCWRDVNLSLGSISVTRSAYRKDGGIHYKEPKTQHSRRRISISPQVCLYLKGYRAERERIAAEIEHPLEPDNLVFSMPDGGPLSANSLIPAFQRIVRRAGLEPLRFHDLRHGCASLMFLAGVHPKVVSEMLGHSSIGITLDVYSHVLPSMQDAAVVALDEVLSEKLAANWQQKGEIEDWLT